MTPSSESAPGAAPAPQRPQDLEQWLAYLETVNSRVIEMGLERVRRVQQAMGLAPGFPVITVAGTNGKGSVCALLEAILSCAGYRVGCYTSPHLIEYNERVRIGRAPVSDRDLCRAFAAVDAARHGTPLTYFEYGTLAAMLLFMEQRVEVGILEVGLGGRLDAVNVFDNDCAVITSVDFDHMEYLGHTREAIGFEKAGIFRRGKAAVCGDPDPPATVEQHALDTGTDFMTLERDFGHSSDGGQWSYWGYGVRRSGLPLPALRGSYQINNASVCLAVLEELKDRLPATMGDIRRGLVEVNLAGRFQVLPGRPAVILDVAHNPHAARALAANLAAMGRFRKTVAVLGMLKDKDIPAVIRAVQSAIDVWLVAGLDAPRGADAETLLDLLRAQGVSGEMHAFPSPAAAYGEACVRAGEDDRIIVFGSFLTVADVMRQRKTARS